MENARSFLNFRDGNRTKNNEICIYGIPHPNWKYMVPKYIGNIVFLIGILE
jgi:hypothetical protein